MAVFVPFLSGGAEELASIVVGGDDLDDDQWGLFCKGGVDVPAATQAITAITSGPDMILL